MSHKETLVPVPALFLGRAHTERRQMATATEWPTTADLGPNGFQGPDNAARFFVSNLSCRTFNFVILVECPTQPFE